MATDAQKQVYDNVIKRLIENQYTAVLPLLFPGLNPGRIEELTTEVLIPPRRTDKVYMITGSGKKFILHLEAEVSPKSRGEVSRRMLIYHALLLEKYDKYEDGIAVLTYVLYPFRAPRGNPKSLKRLRAKNFCAFLIARFC
ncbi:MAG TPA: hypothetical protein VGD98_25295 [Ktedonobacteraceae bacterium]